MSWMIRIEEGSTARPLVTISVYSAISQAALGLSYPGTPLYLYLVGLEQSIINVILAFVAIASLFGQVLWGYLSDRTLSKLAYVEMGTAGSLLGFLILANTKDMLVFSIILVVTNFVGSAAYPAAMALLADVSPSRNRGRSMGIFWSAASVGWAVAVAFTGWIVENLGGSVLFGSCALLSLASLLVMHLGLRGHGQARRKTDDSIGSRPSFFSLISNLSQSFFVFLAGTIMFLILDFAKNVYIPLFYAFEVKLSATVATLLLSMTSWIEVPATILFGMLSDRVGRKKVVLTSYLLASIYMLVNVWVSGIELAVLAMGIYGLVWGAFSGASSALASELVAEENRGFAMGIFNSSYSIANIITPLSIGSIAQLFGYRSSFASMGILMALFSLLFLVGIREETDAEGVTTHVIETHEKRIDPSVRSAMISLQYPKGI